MTNKPTNLNAHMRPGQALGTFTLNEQSLAQVRAAMKITRLMRSGGDDGEVEDAARAIVLLFGACMFDDDWLDVVFKDTADLDRQEVAYMDGVAELREAFPMFTGAHLCRYRYAA